MQSDINNNKLTTLIHEQIPLTKAMGIHVVRADQKGALVVAPLAENCNHMGMAFGGSLQTVLIVSAYVYMHFLLNRKELSADILLKSSRVEYLYPVRKQIRAQCSAASKAAVAKFYQTLERKKIARLVVSADISHSKTLACKLQAEFVAKLSLASL